MTSVLFCGNPNSGKTSLFNAITGFRYKVANYPGVTVERKEATYKLPNGTTVELTDLPGIYDLHGLALDEQLASQSILDLTKSDKDSLIVAVVDATHLERNLFFLSQILDLNLPVIVAVNMIDVLESQNIRFYPDLLSRTLGVPVVGVSAKKKKGITELLDTIEKNILKKPLPPKLLQWIPQDETGERFKNSINSLIEASNNSISVMDSISMLAGIKESPGELKSKLSLELEELHKINIEPESYEASSRYQWIEETLASCQALSVTPTHKWTRKIDSILTHKIWGFIIFISVIALMFHSLFTLANYPMDLIDASVSSLGTWVQETLPSGILSNLIVDGIIAGVGSVIIFIPHIAILFLFLGILEDSGYLARAAFLMDRIMRPFGLQGRSFIPLLNAFACAIPAILSTRTISSRSDRLTTILIAPLMSCSARLPVYTVLIAACIPDVHLFGIISLQGSVLFGMYLLGIVGAIFVSLILKRTILKRQTAHFVMEMPPYRRPSVRSVIRETLDRVKEFLIRAGTVILACSILLWALSSYPAPPDNFSGSPLEYSLAGRAGKLIEPIITPLGYTWEFGIAIIASFAAREVFVSALSTVYNISSSSDSTESLIQILSNKMSDGSFSLASGLSLMVFFVFACQCISTIAIVYRETRSKRWTIGMVAYMMILAYLGALFTYRITLYLT